MKTTTALLLFLALMMSPKVHADVKDTTAVDSIRKDAIRLFIDCNSCDISFIKKNITFVNYVRDTKDAQVHLMITINQTGSNGYEYGLFFYRTK